MRLIKVFVGVPSQETWKADFGMSLVHMVAMVSQPLRDGTKIQSCRLWNSRGSILPKLRTTLVKQALQSEATHILFIDSDMVFPAETLHKLLERGKAVIGCNCPVKTIPSSPTARQEGGDRGMPVYAAPDDFGIEKVWRVGTGIMLVETRVFKQIPEPWFPVEWNEKTGDYTGEDWAFCEKLEAAGIPIYIDRQLSKLIGHVGSFTYEHKHVEIPDGHERSGNARCVEPVRYSHEFGVSPSGDRLDEVNCTAGAGAKSYNQANGDCEVRRAE